MEPAKAAEAIRAHIDGRQPVTVADAAAKTGLALRDAESGLNWLSKEFRGQLRVTGDGVLVHVFPQGFTKPWERTDALRAFGRRAGRLLMGAVRFVVRAWVTIVLVGYALLFVALMFAMLASRSNDRRDGGDSLGGLGYALWRVLSEALFWTFRPWSPFSVYSYPYYGGYDAGYAPGWGAPQARYAPQRRNEGPKVPLYERVNRFFFGPPAPPEDPLENERRILAAIRAGKGRVGLADVMRVTGLPRHEADPLMAKLMLDYDGDVAVSEEGGIVYRFPEIRRTAGETKDAEPAPAWARSHAPEPLTGNSAGVNFAVILLNGFNLLGGAWAIENGMTIERLSHLFDRIPYHVLDTGTPILLGVIPLVFSTLLFVVPTMRVLARPWKLRKAAEERGRLAVMRVVLERLRSKQPVTDAAATEAWRVASGDAPERRRVDKELVALGGDVAIEPDGRTRWRFPDLETEAAAVEAEREAASEEEARLGPIAYATDER
jgi:hypothetical protein